MNTVQGTGATAGALGCTLAARALVRVPIEEAAQLRRPSLPPGLPAPPASLLKHAEEQALAALAAVYRAAEGLAGSDFRDWGVVAGTRFLGKASVSVTVGRFLEEGAWGVSPHIIPYRSLHTVSGLISVALGARGPNFGVGGGPGSEAEGLLAGLTLLAGEALPGTWLVLSRLEPEQAVHASGGVADGTVCEALALALVPSGANGLELRLYPGRAFPNCALDLADLVTLLDRAERDGLARAPLPGGMWLELERRAGARAAWPARRSA